MNIADDLASRAGTAIQRVCILHIVRIAVIAAREIELVVIGNTLQQIPRPLEAQLWFLMQQQLGFIGAT